MSTARRRATKQAGKNEAVGRREPDTATPHRSDPATPKGGSAPRSVFLAGFAAVVLCLYVYYSSLSSPDGKWQPQALPLDLPFTVVDIPGKGKGSIAARDIKQGERILREEPLFILPSQVRVQGSPGAIVLSALASLSPHQRDAFYNLSYVNFPRHLTPNSPSYHETMALAIFETNAIGADDDGTGIFPTTARLNHGCSAAFNAVYSWRSSEGALVVHALKNIKEGEELLTTYFDTKRPRDSRREHLRTHYGFTCQCSVCSLPDGESQKSDSRLLKMAELYERFRTWRDGALTGKQAVDVAREIWALGDEEGYWSERGQLAADAAWVAAAHADLRATRSWAQLAQKWFGFELGADSTHARSMDEVIANPDSLRYRTGATRAPENVGSPDA
ncbi:SET domain-containing protein [Phanerochaete sordida]|uniref:SET domain-containing protein n=1 Tax=Phanerochaete sordida TaxID=48140 RepID=A0A9P3GPN7_9APHY|nr:SET domain-containing protein [Phanerochaete sordida]